MDPARSNTQRPSPLDAKVVRTEPLKADEARWIRLKKVTWTDPTHKERIWESAERTTRPKGATADGVGIVAILNDDETDDPSSSSSSAQGPRILLQKQFRPPVNKVSIEVPAGLLDPNESIETCALRELKEETGYVGKVVPGGWGISPVMFNDPGFCNTNVHMVYVSVDLTLPENQNPQPELEENEFIECFTVPLRHFHRECKRLESEGYAIDARVGTLAEGIEMARRLKIT